MVPVHIMDSILNSSLKDMNEDNLNNTYRITDCPG